MKKKDLLFFLEDFSEEDEICFWSNGKAHPVTEVKDDKSRGIVLLKSNSSSSPATIDSSDK